MKEDSTIKNQNELGNYQYVAETRKRIMVVEDDRTHRAMMDKILQSHNFITSQAESGFIALSKIDAGEVFDLIIMDWDMPGLDGLETVKKIREREVKHNQARIPVVAFTGKSSEGDREQCLAAGMDAYMTKNGKCRSWTGMRQ